MCENKDTKNGGEGSAQTSGTASAPDIVQEVAALVRAQLGVKTALVPLHNGAVAVEALHQGARLYFAPDTGGAPAAFVFQDMLAPPSFGLVYGLVYKTAQDIPGLLATYKNERGSDTAKIARMLQNAERTRPARIAELFARLSEREKERVENFLFAAEERDQKPALAAQHEAMEFFQCIVPDLGGDANEETLCRRWDLTPGQLERLRRAYDTLRAVHEEVQAFCEAAYKAEAQ